VIELRRRERHHQEHADDGGSEPPEWHVQWLGSGLSRRRWYPLAKAHKPRYIAPYVKGQQDKPLKTPDKPAVSGQALSCASGAERTTRLIAGAGGTRERSASDPARGCDRW